MMMENRNLNRHLLFTCGREPEYIRNEVLVRALQPHFHLSKAVDSTKFLPWRYLKVVLKFIKNMRGMDCVLVGFYGQPLMLIIPLLFKKPILFDVFLSTYEVLCFERKKFKPESLIGKLAFWIDKTSCLRARHILTHTETDIEYYQKTFNIDRQKFSRVFIGCNEKIFYPRKEIQTIRGRVLFWGSYLPNQGVEYIAHAANLLRDHPFIHFRFLGEGLESSKLRRLVREYKLENVEFVPWKPPSEQAIEIAQADVLLTGEFGLCEKAGRVIAGKTFQSIAMGKAPVVADNPANRELLTPGEDAVFCRAADPIAIADAIREVVEDPEAQLRRSEKCHKVFLERASNVVIGDELNRIISKMLN
jgi:glycosyltransferase involved in cell wall biosynthesis